MTSEQGSPQMILFPSAETLSTRSPVLLPTVSPFRPHHQLGRNNEILLFIRASSFRPPKAFSISSRFVRNFSPKPTLSARKSAKSPGNKYSRQVRALRHVHSNPRTSRATNSLPLDSYRSHPALALFIDRSRPHDFPIVAWPFRIHQRKQTAQFSRLARVLVNGAGTQTIFARSFRPTAKVIVILLQLAPCFHAISSPTLQLPPWRLLICCVAHALFCSKIFRQPNGSGSILVRGIGHPPPGLA